jgi:hypothetical protein
MKAVFDAFNIVYDEEEKRSFLWLNAQSLIFTLASIVILPVVLDFAGLGTAVEWLLSLARWPILLAAVIARLAVLYRYGPSRDKAEWKWVTPGGIVASVPWLIGSILFSWDVSNFGSYNETDGSLGAAIGFMTWIWLSSIIVLLGAELNAEMEHQTAQDTTQGSPQPLGRAARRWPTTSDQPRHKPGHLSYPFELLPCSCPAASFRSWSRTSQWTEPSARMAAANPMMVSGSVLVASRMMNLRTRARSAISTTVRTCTMLSLRCRTPMVEWLNSRAISTVKIMPRSPRTRPSRPGRAARTAAA